MTIEDYNTNLPTHNPVVVDDNTIEDIEDIINVKSIFETNKTNSNKPQTVRIKRLVKPVTDCCGGGGSCEQTQEPNHSSCCSSSLSNDCQKTEHTTTAGSLPTDNGTPELNELNTNDLNPANHTVYLKTWGCSHNNSDSEYMAGLIAQAGYNVTTTNYNNASIILLNSCTVKGPSEQHFKNEIEKATSSKKHIILAGCVPQSDKSYKKIASTIGVQQIDRIVEVVEETLKGNKVCFTSGIRKSSSNGGSKREAGADLGLPKIRKNEFVEIVPISSGCLNNCTYCKTKLARGHLVSYSIDAIATRIQNVVTTENVKEVWLTSEDLGAWGIDIGLTIVDLLHRIVRVLEGTTVMLRLGMTNPPYILDHLQEISNILSHPNVYEFLHIPVQSGSDSVLLEMKREYCVKQFESICDFMLERHPTITLATDIICGYPTETQQDFTETYELVKKYKFPVLFINQFYPRPGTPAAKLKRLTTQTVKSRSRQLHELFQSYQSLTPKLIGSTQRILVTDIAHDKVKYVGHNKSYQQVLVDLKDPQRVLGTWVDCAITEVGKFSMIGEVIVSANYDSRKFFLFLLLPLIILLISIFYGTFM